MQDGLHYIGSVAEEAQNILADMTQEMIFPTNGSHPTASKLF